MGDKSDFYKPTAHLRFVVRYEPLPPDMTCSRAVNVLQQKWTSPFGGDEDQWRDVPIVENDI